jgi:hypothetical protein
MDNFRKVRVLLIGDNPQLFFSCQKHLQRNGCECEFAESERAVWERLRQRQFDLVLSLHASRGSGGPSLVVLLRGSQTTLLHAMRLEVGCCWVPLLRLGQECYGNPVLCPSEFANVIDEVLKEIRAGYMKTAYHASTSVSQSLRAS